MSPINGTIVRNGLQNEAFYSEMTVIYQEKVSTYVSDIRGKNL